MIASASEADPGALGSNRLSFSERISLPYGGPVRREASELAARALARQAVLRQAETVLAGLTAVRFGLDDMRQLTALTYMVLPPMVSTLPSLSGEDAAGKDAGETGSTTAQADVFAALPVLPEAIRAALARSEDLEMQAEALDLITQLAEELSFLIHAAVRQEKPTKQQPAAWSASGQQENDLAAGRLANLALRLRATERYLELLENFGAAWTPPGEAERALRVLLRLDPDNPLTNLGMAEALLRLDRPHEAIRFAGEALRQEPELARALYVRGMIQLRLRLSALAVVDFSQALALRPGKAAWLRARGAAYMIQHNYEAMCADLYQACTLGDCDGLAEVRGQNLCFAQP